MSMFAECASPITMDFKLPAFGGQVMAAIKFKKCKYCPFRAISKLLFLRHCCDKETKKYKCEICGRVFIKYSTYYQHFKVHHTDRSQWPKCDFCDYRAALKMKIQIHVWRNHLNEDEKREKWFQCELCDYQNALKAALKQHLLMKHSTSDWLKCQFDSCSYKTKVELNLKKHIVKSHSAEKRDDVWFYCELCDYSSQTKRNLKQHLGRHMRRNKPIERVQCKVCEMWFSDVSIRSHIKNVHTDKQEFKCDFCDKTFSYKKTRSRHIQEVHLNPKKIKSRSQTGFTIGKP